MTRCVCQDELFFFFLYEKVPKTLKAVTQKVQFNKIINMHKTFSINLPCKFVQVVPECGRRPLGLFTESLELCSCPEEIFLYSFILHCKPLHCRPNGLEDDIVPWVQDGVGSK